MNLSGRTNVAPASREGARFFDTQAERWMSLYETRAAFKDRLSLFSQAVSRVVPAPGPVLDFGCGPGVLALSLGQMGYDVLGVDGAPSMIARAREGKDRRQVSNAIFEVMDTDALDLPLETFAGITCSSVIEYVNNDAALIAAFARALLPGGHLFISVPHSGSVIGLLEDLLTRLPAYRNREGRRHLAFSLRRYRRSSFCEALEREGLVTRAVTYFEGPLPGGFGRRLSRLPPIGVMMLVTCQKG